jgi:hypothetical protein
LWASSERRSAGGRQYSYHTRETVPRALVQIGQALALLGESVDQDRLREVTASIFAFGASVELRSRARYDLGSGLALVTYSDKIHVELPVAVMRAFTNWLALGEPVAVG